MNILKTQPIRSISYDQKGRMRRGFDEQAFDPDRYPKHPAGSALAKKEAQAHQEFEDALAHANEDLFDDHHH